MSNFCLLAPRHAVCYTRSQPLHGLELKFATLLFRALSTMLSVAELLLLIPLRKSSYTNEERETFAIYNFILLLESCSDGVMYCVCVDSQ